MSNFVTQEMGYMRARNFADMFSYPEISTLYFFASDISGGVSESDTDASEEHTRREMLFAKRVLPSNIHYMVPDRLWVSSLTLSKNDYVRTSANKVYILIGKESSAATIGSTEPSTTGTTPQKVNGHYWKYLYTISDTSLIADSYMPVQSSPNASSAIGGEIIAVELLTNPPMANAIDSMIVMGDGTGFSANVLSTSGNVSSVSIDANGSGYSSVFYANAASVDGNFSANFFITQNPAEEANVPRTLKANVLLIETTFGDNGSNSSSNVNSNFFRSFDYGSGVNKNRYNRVGLLLDPIDTSTNSVALKSDYCACMRIGAYWNDWLEPANTSITISDSEYSNTTLTAVTNFATGGPSSLGSPTYGTGYFIIGTNSQRYYPSWNVSSNLVSVSGNTSINTTNVTEIVSPGLDCFSGQIVYQNILNTSVRRQSGQSEYHSVLLKF